MRFSRFLFLTVFASFDASLLAQVLPVATFQGKDAVANEIILRLNDNAPSTLTNVAAYALSGEDVKRISTVAPIHVVHSNSRNVDVLIGAFAHLPGVAYAEANYILKTVATPNDPNYSQLWAMPVISAPQAWNITTGSTANVIGVVDTGIDYTHQDLAANVWSAPAAFTVTLNGTQITCPAGSHGFNAITLVCDPMDDNNHGSHVSGTIGAVGNNGLGVAGLNWNAKIMGLKFLNSSGSGSTSAAIMAIDFAIQAKAAFASTATPVNVRVLSNSWGGSGADQSLLDEINLANTNNMLFVAAAGNNGTDNGVTTFYPADFTAPNVIAVAATDSNDNLASFSNYGSTTVHLGAPGVSILSTIIGNQYAYFSGTSMATPHVAGSALLTLGACPALTTAGLKAAILNNVDQIASLAGKTITGGRLDVYKAINSCSQSQSTPHSITPVSGGGQSVNVGTTFGTALQAKVLDASSNPVAGVTVTFTAPSSGASATFPGGVNTATAPTNASGLATAPALTANSTPGTYNVSASVSSLTPAVFTLTNTSSSSSSPIAIFGTGIASGGGLAADGGADAHYTLISSADPIAPGPNAYVMNSSGYPFGYWMADGPNSKWITPMASQSVGNLPGNYTYRTTFNLSGFNASTAVLTGQVVVDDTVVIYLNGVAASGSIRGYTNWTPFTLTGGFLPGVNTLDFVVNNYGTVANPTGLRVEVSGTATPSSGITVTVSPKTVSLGPSGQQTFTVTVTGTSNPNVTWTLTPNVGSFTGNTYTAPSPISSTQTVTAKALSQADNTTFDTATITLNPATSTSIAIFGTGIASGGGLAADGAVDAHYTLISSADPIAPGPNAYVMNSSGYPFGYWMPDGPNSKWITPMASQSVGNLPGNYTYRTTFNLSGFNPSTAVLTGQVLVDDTVVIYLNGVAVSGSIKGYTNWTPFTLNSGFVSGVNTLDFVVNNYGTVANPTGLRVEVSGTATPSSGITVTVSPKTVSLGPSGQQTFTVSVTGTSNPNVTWTLTPNVGSFSGNTYTAPSPISSTQTVTAKALSQADNTTFDTATITLNPSTSSAIAIFGTGIAIGGGLAADGAVDAHYTLISSADPIAPGPNAYVMNSSGYPFGYWMPDGPNSKWITPMASQSVGNLPGNYTYRTTFNLSGFNASTAVLTGQVLVDDTVVIYLNGVAVSGSIRGYTNWTPFTLNSGFLSGVNTLDFVVNNYGSVANPTGLRVEVSGTVSH